MPNTKEIKNRIGSVQNTQKITNAMYLISSTKMRKAKEELERTRPYFEMQENEIRRIFQTEIDITSRYFYPKTGRKPAETYAYLGNNSDAELQQLLEDYYNSSATDASATDSDAE